MKINGNTSVPLKGTSSSELDLKISCFGINPENIFFKKVTKLQGNFCEYRWIMPSSFFVANGLEYSNSCCQIRKHVPRNT